MKKQICVSVDIDTFLIAKQKVPNISKYLNDCLIGIAGKDMSDLKKEEVQDKIQTIMDEIKNKNVELSLLNIQLGEIDAEVLKKKEEERTKALRERWKCGACGQLNIMDNERCNGCNLPTREDKKTTITMID